MSDGKGSTKNKFELQRLDHDSHVNHSEVYAISIKCKIMIWRSHILSNYK